MRLVVIHANVSAISLRGTHCFLSVTCSLSPSDKEVEVCNIFLYKVNDLVYPVFQ